MTVDPVVWIGLFMERNKISIDNSKGWKGVKSNLDGSDHADKDKTYDWNGSVWVEA